jgi:hypothetical protein
MSRPLAAAAILFLAACGGSRGAPAGAVDAAAADAPPGETVAADGSEASAVVGAEAAAPTPCDASTGTTMAPDAAAIASSATTYFAVGGTLDNRECLPETLAVNAAGQASCQIFILLSAGDSCSAHAGLSAVGADVTASVRAAAPSAPGVVCALAQLPRSDWACGSCEASTVPGWCYVTPAPGACPQQILASAAWTMPAGALAMLGCGATTSETPAASSSASVGASCVPSPELSTSFGGFDLDGVTLDENNAACTGSVCLVNHFQGLTGCPYGQQADGEPIAGSPGTTCTAAGTSTPVQVAVQPQCVDRRASQTVYCSCRCANVEGATDDGAAYCACPSGYSCTQVVPAIESGDPRAGAYCIQSGTALVSGDVCGGPSACGGSGTGNCPRAGAGERRQRSPLRRASMAAPGRFREGRDESLVPP